MFYSLEEFLIDNDYSIEEYKNRLAGTFPITEKSLEILYVIKNYKMLSNSEIENITSDGLYHLFEYSFDWSQTPEGNSFFQEMSEKWGEFIEEYNIGNIYINAKKARFALETEPTVVSALTHTREGELNEI